MSSTPVCYLGSGRDLSGYGSANRAFIAALYIAGVDITTETVVQLRDQTQLGWQGELWKSLEGRKIPYKVKIIHLTPDIYPNYMEKGAYHIGHLFWETDKLPKEWVEPCNKMGEIWTSSSNMAELFKKSGVKVPIYWFPQPISIHDADRDLGRFQIPNHKGFLFYSIFQWIERKNPKALLTAYWEAFQGRDDVSLLLKTYRVTFDNEEFNKIRDDIQQWKRERLFKHYPKVFLCKSLLTHEQILKLHQTGDCYVSSDHGEGWNRCVQEALLMGKPVVSTARGGIHEWITNDIYYPVNSTYVPVKEQSWIPWYTKEQNWAEVDKEELKSRMLEVYRNQVGAMAKGVLAKDYIKDQFSFHRIGEMMKQRLTEIYKAL